LQVKRLSTWEDNSRQVKAVDQLQLPLQIFAAHQIQKNCNVLHNGTRMDLQYWNNGEKVKINMRSR
jgi:hypothetical protein